MARATHRLSLANVRTHTTRKTSPALQKHELYMKLTSLEIERSRRATEREATAKRIDIIDQRLAVIVAEQNHLRELLEDRSEAESSAVAQPKNSKATEKSAKQGMNLKY